MGGVGDDPRDLGSADPLCAQENSVDRLRRIRDGRGAGQTAALNLLIPHGSEQKVIQAGAIAFRIDPDADQH